MPHQLFYVNRVSHIFSSREATSTDYIVRHLVRYDGKLAKRLSLLGTLNYLYFYHDFENENLLFPFLSSFCRFCCCCGFSIASLWRHKSPGIGTLLTRKVGSRYYNRCIRLFYSVITRCIGRVYSVMTRCIGRVYSVTTRCIGIFYSVITR